MKTDFKKMSFLRTLLAGFFGGLISAFVVVIYAIIYRSSTDFDGLPALSPLLIFIGVPFAMVVAGGIYYILVHYLAKGELLFIILFAALVLISIALDLNFQASGNEKLITTENGLLFGVEIIAGLSICILIPYLTHHPAIYMTAERLKWEK